MRGLLSDPEQAGGLLKTALVCLLSVTAALLLALCSKKKKDRLKAAGGGEKTETTEPEDCEPDEVEVEKKELEGEKPKRELKPPTGGGITGTHDPNYQTFAAVPKNADFGADKAAGAGGAGGGGLPKAPAAGLTPIEKAKRAAAFAAAKQHVKPGCKLGVGSGSTARFLVEWLEKEFKEGHLAGILCVPTSQRTEQWLIDAGLPVSDLDSCPSLDLAIDGADEVEVPSLRLIKGGGGAHTREKIVEHAASKFFVIADDTKKSSRLGDKFPYLPIEILAFAATPLCLEIPSRFGGTATIRKAAGEPFVTDSGGFIIDWFFPKNSYKDCLSFLHSRSSRDGIVPGSKR